jgi:hypothetical protein
MQMVLCGGVGRPYPTFSAKCDALPVPGADGKIVCVFSPAFGRRENAGNVMLVDLKAGPGEWSAARQISPELPDLGWSTGSGQGPKGFRDPYPLSADCFLVARDTSLLVLDGTGNTEEFYRAEKMVHDPRVIRSRLREPVLPTRAKDADYQAILQAIQAAKVRQEQYGRPDIRGFRPGDYYLRWMKRFGILPEDFDLAKEGLDPYETDQAYWRSLRHRPAAVRSASMAGQGR